MTESYLTARALDVRGFPQSFLPFVTIVHNDRAPQSNRTSPHLLRKGVGGRRVLEESQDGGGMPGGRMHGAKQVQGGLAGLGRQP